MGGNSSGKSYFLRVVTQMDEYNVVRKNLVWSDISNDTKNEYYNYVVEKQDEREF